MDTFDDEDNTQRDDRLDAQRKIIKASLNEIAKEVGMIMRDEGLRFPVYITVKNSGDSLATIATRSIRQMQNGRVRPKSSAKS